ncbi:MAG: hypothetical protein R3349_12885 [Geminicoccaceae bacterium]|nr:hypothetical protein [Geminicoccaceae bacterium]
MTVLYIVSEGRPEREQILGEVPLQRCIEEFGLDPSQRVYGLREGPAAFVHGSAGGASATDGHQVVAGVGPDEARDGFTAGYYWLDLSPSEVRRRLG